MMRSWKKGVIFVFLGMMGGCIHIPEKDLFTPATSADCDAATADAVASGVFEAGEWPAKKWWEELQDETLTKLIEESLKSSPNLMAAEARFQAASQFALQKRAALFPEVGLSVTDQWQHFAKQGFYRAVAPDMPAVINDFNFDFTFNYEIDFWGKNRDLFQAAMGEAAAAAAEKLQTELLLATAVAHTYAQLQFLLKEREILLRKEANRKAVLTVRGKRVERALDTAAQDLFARALSLDVQALLADIDPQIEKQIHLLKSLSGLGQNAVLDIRLNPMVPLQVAVPENLSLDLIARRPDLMAQKARLEAAAKRIDAAKTDFYPNVNLSALVGIESIFWSKLFRKENYSGSIEPALNLPIFTAGRLRAQLAEKVIEFDAAVAIYNNLILQAAQEVTDNLTAVIYLQKEIDIRWNSLRVAEKQQDLSRRRLEHALDDRIVYLEAENRVLDAELALAVLEYGKQMAGILLIRALGGGYNGS